MTAVSNCPICLSKPNIPTVLGCSHIFCYLCLKGSSTSHMNCPICRQEKSIKLAAKSAKWSYQGRGGYWLFDRVTNGYMENAYQNKRSTCEVLIAGNTYVIDFAKMIQFRKDIPGKRRHIKRHIDLDRKEIKGVAGVSQRLLKVKLKRSRISANYSWEGTSSISHSPEDDDQEDDSQPDLTREVTVKREEDEDLDTPHLPVVVSGSLLTKIKEEIKDPSSEKIVKIKEEPEW